MPLYEYICPNCGYTQEELLSIKEADMSILVCDMCLDDIGLKPIMTRNIGKARFKFKGGSPTKSRCPE